MTEDKKPSGKKHEILLVRNYWPKDSGEKESKGEVIKVEAAEAKYLVERRIGARANEADFD